MSYLGQIPTNSAPQQAPQPTPQPVAQAPQWAAGVAAIVDPLAQATSQIYSTKMRADIDTARIKAGLPPMVYAGEVPLPLPQRRGLSSTSLLLGIVVIGGLVYMISKR